MLIGNHGCRLLMAKNVWKDNTVKIKELTKVTVVHTAGVKLLIDQSVLMTKVVLFKEIKALSLCCVLKTIKFNEVTKIGN